MKPSIKSLLGAIGVAVLGASVALVLAFLIWPASWVARVYIWPGQALMPVLGWALPDRLIYALVPDGGAPAALLVVLLGSSFTWGAAFLAIWTLARRVTSHVRRNRA